MEGKIYTPMHLQLMPIRCYNCGKPIRQLAIEKGIENGDIMASLNDLGYERMCCRNVILSSPVAVELRKKVQKGAEEFIKSMGLEETSGLSSGITIRTAVNVSNIPISSRELPQSTATRDSYSYELEKIV